MKHSHEAILDSIKKLLDQAVAIHANNLLQNHNEVRGSQIVALARLLPEIDILPMDTPAVQIRTIGRLRALREQAEVVELDEATTALDRAVQEFQDAWPTEFALADVRQLISEGRVLHGALRAELEKDATLRPDDLDVLLR